MPEIDSAAIVSISAAVVALTQLIKWSGLPDKYGPLAVLALAAVGMGIWSYSNGGYSDSQVFNYFTGWIAVATSAAGVFGFTRASASAVTKTTSPPPGAGQSPTTKE